MSLQWPQRICQYTTATFADIAEYTIRLRPNESLIDQSNIRVSLSDDYTRAVLKTSYIGAGNSSRCYVGRSGYHDHYYYLRSTTQESYWIRKVSYIFHELWKLLTKFCRTNKMIDLLTLYTITSGLLPTYVRFDQNSHIGYQCLRADMFVCVFSIICIGSLISVCLTNICHVYMASQ